VELHFLAGEVVAQGYGLIERLLKSSGEKVGDKCVVGYPLL
jgi:hypothetical protein